jgi:hypothetical protein
MLSGRKMTAACSKARDKALASIYHTGSLGDKYCHATTINRALHMHGVRRRDFPDARITAIKWLELQNERVCLTEV